jgi:UDP-N-acetylglucosamine:LPS N-acetylglucosamine transferase
VADRREILLVCSTGGHLLQLVALRRAWVGLSRVWVTFDGGDTRSLLAGEHVVHAFGPTNRDVPNLLRNLLLAARVVRRHRPRVVLTTGAGVAVPFAWIGRLSGARVVYVESVTRIDTPSLSYRLIRPVVSRTYVQWPELLGPLRDAHYSGSVLDP